jgi:CheY-like chemotaxis protein
MATILVVDDESPIRELLVALFESVGHRALQAAHGREAMALVEAERPDAVISDVMMPLMDGSELCRRVKADPATQRTPVLLMSALPIERAKGAGADALISKPFDLDEIEVLVERLLERRPASPV